MATRSRIRIEQSQRLSLNTGLIASIRLLSSDAMGLSRFLEETAKTNPQLLVAPPPLPPGEWLPRWSSAFAGLAGGRGGVPVDSLPDAASSGLIAHVGAAVAGLRLAPADARAAQVFIEALEPTGWLGRPLAEVAQDCGLSLPQAEAVLAKLQQVEPAGLFARNLTECLRLQAAEAGWLDALADGVLHRLLLVSAGRTDRIAADLGVGEPAVLAVIARIRRLDPKPGAGFGPCDAPLREPDLTARKGPSGWEIALNGSALPTLSLAPQRGAGRAEARALIRLVEGRNATLLKVAREILMRQVAALDEGPGALQPMTMATVGQALGLNQSTISRAVAGTTVDTPRGTWWLRALFSQAIRGQGPSAASLREALARMIAHEDPGHPLSDSALAAALAGAGAPVARRTVTKYREVLGIPAAHLRRKGDRNGRSRG